MTIPIWVLLAFAAWTLLVLGTTHGLYRWGRILTGRSEIKEFAEYRVEGEAGWYRRGMRAHANCVENLPVVAAIVIAAMAFHVESGALDILALVFIGARIPHSLVHILFEQTNVVVAIRSAFFHIQLFAMFGMIGVVAVNAAPI